MFLVGCRDAGRWWRCRTRSATARPVSIARCRTGSSRSSAGWASAGGSSTCSVRGAFRFDGAAAGLHEWSRTMDRRARARDPVAGRLPDDAGAALPLTAIAGPWSARPWSGSGSRACVGCLRATRSAPADSRPPATRESRSSLDSPPAPGPRSGWATGEGMHPGRDHAARPIAVDAAQHGRIERPAARGVDPQPEEVILRADVDRRRPFRRPVRARPKGPQTPRGRHPTDGPEARSTAGPRCAAPARRTSPRRSSQPARCSIQASARTARTGPSATSWPGRPMPPSRSGWASAADRGSARVPPSPMA